MVHVYNKQILHEVVPAIEPIFCVFHRLFLLSLRPRCFSLKRSSSGSISKGSQRVVRNQFIHESTQEWIFEQVQVAN